MPALPCWPSPDRQASCGRATKSALPDLIISSAISGLIMLPTAITGILTSSSLPQPGRLHATPRYVGGISGKLHNCLRQHGWHHNPLLQASLLFSPFCKITAGLYGLRLKRCGRILPARSRMASWSSFTMRKRFLHLRRKHRCVYWWRVKLVNQVTACGTSIRENRR